ncbi:hypothetical protein D3C72_2189450 [compost metagenome]
MLKGLVAAHVDDRIDVLDQHRAFLNASAAGGARPQRLRLYQSGHDRAVRLAAVPADRNARRRAACVRGIGSAGHPDDEILDQLLRVQRLA